MKPTTTRAATTAHGVVTIIWVTTVAHGLLYPPEYFLHFLTLEPLRFEDRQPLGERDLPRLILLYCLGMGIAFAFYSRRGVCLRLMACHLWLWKGALPSGLSLLAVGRV